MGEDFNRELCDARHDFLKENIHTINENIKQLFTRLTWFFILVIGTLSTVIASLIKDWVK